MKKTRISSLLSLVRAVLMIVSSVPVAFINENLAILKHFTDLEDTSKWYFYDMNEATNSHEHYFDDDDNEVWESVTTD